MADTPAAEALDAADPLALFRGAFVRGEALYLDGNSLGPLPLRTPERLAEVVEREWGQGLIRSWNDADWIGAPARVGAKIARLIGARPNEVIVADSTSVNLFKLAVAAMEARPGRPTIVVEDDDFPTDGYMLEGAARLAGGRLERRPRSALSALGDDAALLALCHAHYRTAERYDMAAMTAVAHAAGALTLWDLSHSAGVLAVDLNGAGADLAVGCGYKYLNGGPGAPAFLFVAERLQDQLRSPLQGWLGHAAPFAFEPGYRPAEGVARFACGTPPILGLMALEVGVDLALEAGPAALEAKARALGDLLIALVEAGPAGDELILASPREAARRGGHVSFRHPDAYAVAQALIARGVIGDFRAPDIVRFGVSPLPLSFDDVARAARIIGETVASRAYDDDAYRVRARVT